jgi:hypothetical protein
MVDEHNQDDADFKRKQIRQTQELAKLDQLMSELASVVKNPETFKATDIQIRRIFAAYVEDDSQILNTQIRYHFKDQLDKYLHMKIGFAEINRSYAGSWGIEIPLLNSKKQENVVDLSEEDPSLNPEDILRDLDKK